MNATVPVWFDALQFGQIEVAPDGALSLCYADRWCWMSLRTDPAAVEIVTEI
jgi:hypothetical protein